MTDFWKSAGLHLVERDAEGWLRLTDDYLRAYFTRPEIHPVEESCRAEHALFEKLMATPLAEISGDDLNFIKDKDAADNYRVLLRFRDHLSKHKTLEAAYAALFSGQPIAIPPVFIDQMVHLVLRNILDGVTDPMRLRAAELFFREQMVTVGDDQLMLADREIVEMQSQNGFGALGQLLAEAGTPTREVALDVMTDDNKADYWGRSDNFDMAIDFRFTQSAPDALGRVIEAWIAHFLKIATRIQAVKSIRDEAWSWHIGCDAESTRILNSLYQGEEVDEDSLFHILSLYRMEFRNPEDAMDAVRGKPVYLGVAMNDEKRLVFKPQNLLTNLPIRRD
ncbi:MAG: DUF6352 family protein [Rhizobiaceae bacterium]